MQGKVVKTTGSQYSVQDVDGHLYACTLRGKLRLQGLKVTNPVVVGDEVGFSQLPDQDSGVIHTIFPRKNYLIRQATHKKAYGQLLAANLDQACLVVSATEATGQHLLIDQFLVVAEAFDIPPGIVFNKLDLLSTSQKNALDTLRRLYESLGYNTWAVSAHTGAHLPEWRQGLMGKVSVLSGPSGVGKSTLVNAIAPQAGQAVASNTQASHRGRHTTTYTALFEIAPQSYIIDTPGIHALVPHAVAKQTVAHCFPEIRRYAADCKFYNCTHQHEPACAVLQALAQGSIAASRYQSYCHLLLENVE